MNKSFADHCVSSYLRGEDVIHRQNINFRVNSEWRLDLGTDQFRSFNLEQLMDLPASSSDSLEGHIPRRTIRAHERLRVIDRKHAVFDTSSNEAVCLTIPSTFLEHTTNDREGMLTLSQGGASLRPKTLFGHRPYLQSPGRPRGSSSRLPF